MTGRAIARVGDTNAIGGALMDGSSTVFLDGKPIALHVSRITPHAPWHPRVHYPQHHHDAVTTSNYSTSLFVEGKPVVLKGTQTSCGHPIVNCSESTFAK